MLRGPKNAAQVSNLERNISIRGRGRDFQISVELRDFPQSCATFRKLKQILECSEPA
jgi:hypothetical protein